MYVDNYYGHFRNHFCFNLENNNSPLPKIKSSKIVIKPTLILKYLRQKLWFSAKKPQLLAKSEEKNKRILAFFKASDTHK